MLYNRNATQRGFAGLPHAMWTGICSLEGLPGFPAPSPGPGAFLWLLAAPGTTPRAWQWGQLLAQDLMLQGRAPRAVCLPSKQGSAFCSRISSLHTFAQQINPTRQSFGATGAHPTLLLPAALSLPSVLQHLAVILQVWNCAGLMMASNEMWRLSSHPCLYHS